MHTDIFCNFKKILSMTEIELYSALVLRFSKGIGNVIAKRLIAHFQSAEAVLHTPLSDLAQIPGLGERQLRGLGSEEARRLAKRELDFIEKNAIRGLSFRDSDYPALLKAVGDGPFLLFQKGNIAYPEVLFSVVGTRQLTSYGKRQCEGLIEALSDYEVMIVSGMAYGADIVAHRSALRHGLPTVGVLAHGLDRIYPAPHRKYLESICAQGGLVTEYPSGTKPERENFPVRNRIIAGMSQATLVIEAARKGGALITAHLARGYNREVFAVPGRASDTYSTGCNNLIKKQQAYMLSGIDDLLYHLEWLKGRKSNTKHCERKPDLTPEEEKVIEILKDSDGASLDAIAIKSDMPIAVLAARLLELELKGMVQPLPGKKFRLR